MSVDKLTPNDPRLKKQSVEVEGHRWSFIDAAPHGQQKGTVVLIHGFPDISFTWRNQIPMLTEMGLRCIALDCMGYSDTGTSSDLHDFGFKNHADAIAGICKQLGISNIVIGGHDWGGAVVYRVAQWYPDLVTHVFSVCTPYFKIQDKFVSVEDLIKMGVKQFGYQLQFGSPDQKVENVVTDESKIRAFLQGAYGGKPKHGGHFMVPEKGVDLDSIEKLEVGPTPLLDEEELDYYVKQFAKNGVNGPCNWYRTRKVNFDDELNMPAAQRKGIQQPTLFVLATKDNILTPELARGMEDSIPKLTRGEVPASHWALWQTPKETNEIIKRWFEGVVFGGKNKL